MTRPLLRLGLIVLAIVCATLLVVGFIRDPFGWRQAREHREAVATVQAQADTAQTTTQAVDRYHTQTIVIQKDVAREEQAVQALPGAEAPLDPARRAALCDALGRMRNDPEVCADHRAGEPAPAL